MADALFTINGDDSDQGYEGTAGETLSLQLKTLPVSGVGSVLYQVYAPGFEPSLGIAANPPRQSPGAPLLTLVGATSGSAVAPVGHGGVVTVQLPNDGEAGLGHAWIIRCVVNGGLTALPDGRVVPEPSLIHERMVVLRDGGGCRDVIVTETTQQSDDGWALAFRELRVRLDVGGGGGGTQGPPGSYVGQPVVWDGSTWVPLDLSSALVINRLASEDVLHVEAIVECEVVAPAIRLDASPFGGGQLLVNGSGILLASPALGFYDTAPVPRPSITQNFDGATANAIVNDIIAALVLLGLVTDER